MLLAQRRRRVGAEGLGEGGPCPLEGGEGLGRAAGPDQGVHQRDEPGPRAAGTRRRAPRVRRRRRRVGPPGRRGGRGRAAPAASGRPATPRTPSASTEASSGNGCRATARAPRRPRRRRRRRGRPRAAGTPPRPAARSGWRRRRRRRGRAGTRPVTARRARGAERPTQAGDERLQAVRRVGRRVPAQIVPMSASAETQVPGCSASRPSSNRSRCPGIGTTWPVPAWAPAWAVPAWAVPAWPAWTSSGPSQRTSTPPIIPDAAPAPCRATAAGRPRPRAGSCPPAQPRRTRPGGDPGGGSRRARPGRSRGGALSSPPRAARHVEHELARGSSKLQAQSAAACSPRAAASSACRETRWTGASRVDPAGTRSSRTGRPQPGKRVIGLGTNDARLAAGHGYGAAPSGPGTAVASRRRGAASAVTTVPSPSPATTAHRRSPTTPASSRSIAVTGPARRDLTGNACTLSTLPTGSLVMPPTVRRSGAAWQPGRDPTAARALI